MSPLARLAIRMGRAARRAKAAWLASGSAWPRRSLDYIMWRSYERAYAHVTARLWLEQNP